jgi:hypothetical protein
MHLLTTKVGPALANLQLIEQSLVTLLVVIKLGASFCFKRSERDRGNASQFFTIIAIQLVQSLFGLKSFRSGITSQASLGDNFFHIH